MRCGPSGKLVVIRDRAAGATRAAPTPWTTREAISSTGSWASPPASEASEKAISPVTNIRRRPNRSAARPPRMSSPPKVIAYAVTTHCAADAAKSSSRWIEASATFTMLKSSTTMNAATRMSTRAARLYPGRAGFGRRAESRQGRGGCDGGGSGGRGGGSRACGGSRGGGGGRGNGGERKIRSVLFGDRPALSHSAIRYVSFRIWP